MEEKNELFNNTDEPISEQNAENVIAEEAPVAQTESVEVDNQEIEAADAELNTETAIDEESAEIDNQEVETADSKQTTENVIAKEAVEVDTTAKKPHKRILTGKVISNKPDKTIVISVVTQVMHPLYKKYYKVTKKVMAHDEENTCNEGDTVKIKEHRPLSAKKRWILEEIIQRAK